MIVSHFLKWMPTARANQRAAAATALANAYINRDLPFEERCAAEAALTLLAEDPSAKVRIAIAEAVAMSPHAPPQVVAMLAADQPEVSALVLARSPLLTDADLIDHVAAGRPRTQELIAARPLVSAPVAAAIAEIGEAGACAMLAANDGAEIATLSFRRMAERFGDLPGVREAMIANPALPAECRHVLLVKVGDALKASPLVGRMMGSQRAERLVRDACVKASLTLIDTLRPEEYGALVAHLSLRGDLSSGFIVRTVAHGKVDFLGAVLVAMTRQSDHRVRSLLAGGHDVALAAAFRSIGLDEAVQGILIGALKTWREVAKGKRIAGAQEVSWQMLQQLGGDRAQGELASLLKSIHLDALRENALGHALAIAAA